MRCAYCIELFERGNSLLRENFQRLMDKYGGVASGIPCRRSTHYDVFVKSDVPLSRERLQEEFPDLHIISVWLTHSPLLDREVA